MAGISVLIVLFWSIIVLTSFVAAVTLFVISMVRLKRGNATVTLVISLLLLLPLGITIFGAVITAQKENAAARERLERIENKISVPKDEWREGFSYDGKTLVPVPILMNSANYCSSGERKNLKYLGAVVIENSYDYYSFYQIDNDSGYDIYYVSFADFSYREYFSRTFVDKKDRAAVLDYYSGSNLSVSACWESAPENVGPRYNKAGLDLDINDRRDEWISLCHEVLDGALGRKRSVTPYRDGYDCMSFQIKSDDGVFTVDLYTYTKDGEFTLYLNKYEVNDEIVEKYEEMLFSLISETQAELLQRAAEKE